MNLRMLGQAAVQWQTDKASYLGAAIAYYSLFSVAPILVLAIATAGLVYGKEAAEGKLVGTLQEYVGADSAATLQSLVRQAEPGSGWAAVVGVVVLLVTALGLFQQIKTALHHIWKLESLDEGIVAGTVRSYLLAFITLLISCLFAVCVVSTSTLLTLVLPAWGPRLVQNPLVTYLADFAGSVLLITVLLAFLFRFFSDGRIPYRHLWGGAFVGAFLFVLGKWLFALYLANGAPGTAYGAAGSLVVFLVWVYYSAQLVFFGAEVVQVSRLGDTQTVQ